MDDGEGEVVSVGGWYVVQVLCGTSVAHGMRGVGGVCEMCMCLAQGGVGGEWVSG